MALRSSVWFGGLVLLGGSILAAELAVLVEGPLARIVPVLSAQPPITRALFVLICGSVLLAWSSSLSRRRIGRRFWPPVLYVGPAIALLIGGPMLRMIRDLPLSPGFTPWLSALPSIALIFGVAVWIGVILTAIVFEIARRVIWGR
jgi:hypothetical protein